MLQGNKNNHSYWRVHYDKYLHTIRINMAEGALPSGTFFCPMLKTYWTLHLSYFFHQAWKGLFLFINSSKLFSTSDNHYTCKWRFYMIPVWLSNMFIWYHSKLSHRYESHLTSASWHGSHTRSRFDFHCSTKVRTDIKIQSTLFITDTIGSKIWCP